MELRRATRRELPEIGALTLAAYEEFLAGPEAGYRHQLADATSRFEDAELWVAVDGDGLLGTVTYCPPGSPWRELADDGEGEFRMLAVHPRGRGRGAGHALAHLCENRARADDATRVVLSSLPTMASAHRIYERLGYTRAPERDWTVDVDVHLIAFSKELE